MKKRLIASGVVFVVGFTIGLGLTWALLARKPAPEEGMPVADDTAISTAAAASAPDEAAPTSPTDEPAAAKPPTAQAAIPAKAEPTSPAAVNAPGRPVAAVPKPEANPQPATPKVEAPAEPTAAGAPEPQPTAAPTPGQDPAGDHVPVKTNAWWKGLVGKRVRIDLGRTKALSIRTGGLEDGEVLSWSARFGTKRKLGTLYNGDPNLATVLGVAVSSTGTPVAARVRTTAQGKEVTGVIALHTQGLKIRLHPVD